MKILILSFILGVCLVAGELKLQSGSVTALTGVLFDSQISPKNEDLSTSLSMDASDITSIRGTISVEMGLFKSENADRDAYMYEKLEIEKFTSSTYTIKNVIATKTPNMYIIIGELYLHGVTRALELSALITQDDVTLSMDVSSTINAQNYDIKMPCLLGFTMCVDENIDIKGIAIFKKFSLTDTIKNYIEKINNGISEL
jgi:polyisoprenoid-binding protein YceI